MGEITQSQYWTEVQELAENCVEEAAEYDRDLGDVLHETIDGHQWVIYYAYNADVIKHTDNESYAEENFGTEAYAGKSYSDIGTIVAFWALYADVSEKAYDLAQEAGIEA